MGPLLSAGGAPRALPLLSPTSTSNRAGLRSVDAAEGDENASGRRVSEGGQSGEAEAPGDTLSLSNLARALAARPDAEGSSDSGGRAGSIRRAGAEDSDGDVSDTELTEEEEAQVRELEARDREVRAHENAHKAVAGDLATGGPTYTYSTGPDGKRYAIGGEVRIQLREGRTPEETVRNMERAVRAANAPAEPSSQDRAVAAQAAQRAAQARAEAQAADREPSGSRLDVRA